MTVIAALQKIYLLKRVLGAYALVKGALPSGCDHGNHELVNSSDEV